MITNTSISSREAGRRGGLARSRKHTAKELSDWGKKGGRPATRPRRQNAAK